MFSWFPAQVRHHGLLVATALLVKVVRFRVPVVLKNSFLPASLECPCCGWRGRRFYDYLEVGYRVPNAACPECDSHPRHRALYLWLKEDFHLERRRGRALLFAPERALAPLWVSATGMRVFKTDLRPERDVDLLADMQNLPLQDGSIDLIWCHHVLEQIPNDALAMAELHRVLRNGTGELIVSAGLTGKQKTQEFDGPNNKRSGNRRQYGFDLVSRLERAGFKVQQLTYNLEPAQLKRYSVYPENFYRCIKDAREVSVGNSSTAS